MRASLADFLRWARAHRLAWLAAGWVAALLLVKLAANPGLTSTAARGAYILLAVYAVQLLASETGQPSLGHGAFLALGAYATAGLRLRVGLDGALAAVVATGLGGAVGWGVGWGASRLRAPILALLTWSLGWLAFVALGAFPEVTGGAAGIAFRAPMRVRWDLLGIDIRLGDFGHLLLGSVLLALFLLLYRSARGSSIGRAWAALRDSRTLAVSLGYDVASIRRWTFAVSAAVAALAGSLGAQLVQVVDPSLYSPLQSLNLFVAVLIGAPLGFFGPVVGAIVTTGSPAAVDYISQFSGVPLGTGRQLLAAVLTVAALWISVRVTHRAQARTPSSPRRPPHQAGSLPAAPARRAPRARAGEPVLEATEVIVHFEGVRALDRASIALPAGAIHGLVGPNGSGKTTLLRVLAGTVTPVGGRVVLGGRNIDNLDEARRVRAGLVRTFQRTAVVPDLLAREHVEVGLGLRYRHASVLQAVLKSPANRAEAMGSRRRAVDLLTVFGLEAYADADPKTMPGGHQRLLQMATAVATSPRVLLLDEPSAGMSPDEVAMLHAALVHLAAGGLGILLVEHNMRFLAGVASRVTVLEEGRVLAAGTAAQVARNPEVRRAYLGVSGGPRPRRRSPAGSPPR